MSLLFQPGMRLWWKITAAVYTAGAFALSLYWTTTQSGLPRIFIDIQAGERGVFMPVLTALVTLVILMLPLVVLRFVLPVKGPAAPEDPDAPNLMRWR